MTSRLGHHVLARITMSARQQLTCIPSNGRNHVPHPRFFSTSFPNYDFSSSTSSERSRQEEEKQQRKKKKSAKPSFRFVDKLRLRASGGGGGKGSLSLYCITRKRKFRPDGGHGGDGGSVIVFADPKAQTLRMSSPHVQAASGGNGSGQDKHGRKGKNSIVRVPCGVVVKRILNYDETYDPETMQFTKLGEEERYDYNYWNDFSNENNEEDSENEEEDSQDESDEDDGEISSDMIGFSDMDMLDRDFSDNFDEDDDEGAIDMADRERVVLADLDQPGAFVVVARGGKGGRGSGIFARKHGGLPDGKTLVRAARPEPGEVIYLELELKLIADIGLVGFPNAGALVEYEVGNASWLPYLTLLYPLLLNCL
jgi:GTPase involved in cell partitioning and DNA repair